MRDILTDVPTHISHKNSNNLFSVYPNPSSDIISVNANEHLNGELKIWGIDGKLYKKQKVFGKSLSIDIRDLSDGIYLLIYDNGKNSKVEKIIVSK